MSDKVEFYLHFQIYVIIMKETQLLQESAMIFIWVAIVSS